MSGKPPMRPTRTEARHALWLPPTTRERVFGVVLAITLPCVAALLTANVDALDRFPGVPFLAATIAATLVGRLAAGILATTISAAFFPFFSIRPIGPWGGAQADDLLGLGVLVAVSFVVAYTMARKDASRDEAMAARSDIASLAAALAAERNTMRQIVQQMPNGVLVADGSGRVTLQNTRALEMLGLDEIDARTGSLHVASMPWSAHSLDGTPTTEPSRYPIVRSLRSGEVVIAEQMALDRDDGGTRMIEVDSAPIRDDEAIIGAVAVFQDVTERVAIERRLARTSARVQGMQAVTDAALTGLPFDELTERLLETVRRVLGTDSATLLLVDRDGTALLEHATVGVATDAGQPVPMGRGFAGTIAASVSPLVLDDIASHQTVRHWLDDMRSLMGVPLVYRGRVTGVLHVATRTTRRFTADELELLTLAGNRIASALERAALYDSRSAMAKALQRSLAPESLPEIDGLDLAALYRPYSSDDEIGGDFYDVFPHGDGAWGIVVGDVSGKGPDAAAVMGLAVHTIRAIAPYEARPSSLLLALNDALRRAEHVPTERFCTACEIRVRLDDDHARVTLCLAGHSHPLLIRADGQVCEVGRPGTLLGSFANPTLHDSTFDLARGDALMSYTDGLVERRGRPIDHAEAEIRRAVSTAAGASAADICTHVERALLTDREPEDDVAIVVVRKT